MAWTYRISALGILPFGLYALGDDFPLLWFGGGEPGDLTGVGTLVGFSLILPAVINLLNDQHGRVAPGLSMRRLRLWPVQPDRTRRRVGDLWGR